MKEKLKDKKVVYTIIGIISLLLVVIGITYAYWLVTKTQTNTNTITSACLDITLSGEANDISLTNQFPLSDEDGMALTPYTFTVTNNCNTSVDYQVNLESIGDESTAIASSALKVALNESAKIYSNYSEVETSLSGAYASYRLGYGTLAPSGSDGSSVSYSLRLWIDENAPISEMNKAFNSKISVTIGQGVYNPYQEGSLAYSIVSNYEGFSSIPEIDETIYDHRITASGDQYISTTSNYYYGTEYTYDETEGKYTLSGTLVQATTTECRNGTKTCGKYTLTQTTSTASNATLYEVTDFQSSGNFVTTNRIKYTTPFTVAETTPSLNKAPDDVGDSYYFRGAVTDNYVKFGTYASGSTVNGVTYEEETPMYWRIVRINGDGTIRLIYDGTEKVANGVSHTATIGSTAYNTDYSDAKYSGYTYDDGTGTQVDSTIKGVLDKWYTENLEPIYGNYVADGIFCNDRIILSASENSKIYGSSSRLEHAPILTCINKEDRYTVNDTLNGNGLLTKPLGLLTADEVVLAGGGFSNTDYYLYSSEMLWTSTPYRFNNDIATVLFVWYVESRGYINIDYGVNASLGVRPVINLKADVEFTGDGSFDTPYEIVTN